MRYVGDEEEELGSGRGPNNKPVVCIFAPVQKCNAAGDGNALKLQREQTLSRKCAETTTREQTLSRKFSHPEYITQRQSKFRGYLGDMPRGGRSGE